MDKLIELFCVVDDFCKLLLPYLTPDRDPSEKGSWY